MSFLSFLYVAIANTNKTIVIIKKYISLFGCSQNHTLFIKQFLNPLTRNVTGFKFKSFFTVALCTVSGFHMIPDNQNKAVIKDFTKLL